jgi:carbon storage regulator
MLVLTRGCGERIRIGTDVVVTVIRIGPNNVRIGIDAPRNLLVLREELDGTPERTPATDGQS